MGLERFVGGNLYRERAMCERRGAFSQDDGAPGAVAVGSAIEGTAAVASRRRTAGPSHFIPRGTRSTA